MIAAGGIVAIAAILSIFLFPAVGPLFLILRVVQGAATALVDSGLGTVVADLAPPMLRTRVFALYTVWLTLPGGIMPAVGEAIARHAGFFPLFGAAALALAGALLVFRRLPETRPPVQERVAATWSLGRAGAPVLVGGTIVGFVFGVSSVFVPVAPIAGAPGRVGAFFFAYFVGLFGMRLAKPKVDISLEQGHPDFFEGSINVFFSYKAFSFEFFEERFKFIAYTFEH